MARIVATGCGPPVEAKRAHALGLEPAGSQRADAAVSRDETQGIPCCRQGLRPVPGPVDLGCRDRQDGAMSSCPSAPAT